MIKDRKKIELINKIQSDIATAEDKLRIAKDKLKKMQDEVFLLRIEANKLIDKAYKL